MSTSSTTEISSDFHSYAKNYTIPLYKNFIVVPYLVLIRHDLKLNKGLHLRSPHLSFTFGPKEWLTK